jgi:23S rRNA (cytidine1920-2'-O)/16S rRNA (cytidine1409-2'-O)-methyltransferase
VVAVDVGYGELHATLRADPRVRVLERTNARTLRPAAVGAPAPDLAVVDVSFISLRKVLPAVLACLATERYDVLALVKPQFEAPRERVGKGGVVRDAAVRREALVAVGTAVTEIEPHAAEVLGFCSSGLPGPKGNRETFIWLAEPGRSGGAESAEEIECLAAREEPT